MGGVTITVFRFSVCLSPKISLAGIKVSSVCKTSLYTRDRQPHKLHSSFSFDLYCQIYLQNETRNLKVETR